jgi:hypothetical protein
MNEKTNGEAARLVDGHAIGSDGPAFGVGDVKAEIAAFCARESSFEFKIRFSMLNGLAPCGNSADHRTVDSRRLRGGIGFRLVELLLHFFGVRCVEAATHLTERAPGLFWLQRAAIEVDANETHPPSLAGFFLRAEV